MSVEDNSDNSPIHMNEGVNLVEYDTLSESLFDYFAKHYPEVVFKDEEDACGI